MAKDDCNVCGKHVTRRERGICCDICEAWYHSNCTGMSDIHYNLYKDDKENKINWVCTNCIKAKKEENSIHSMLKEIKKKNDDNNETIRQERETSRQEREDSRLERKQMMDMMKQLTDQMKKLEDKMESKMDDKLKTSEREMALKVSNEIDEKLERFRRKNNIVLYGVPESKKGNENDRMKEDIEKTNLLLEKIEIKVEKFELARLGNKINAGKARSIKIELDKEEDKYKILKGAGKIKNVEDENLKKIIISPDMTIKQRELDRNLREELKNRRQAGETNIKIKNGRIVVIGRQDQINQE